MDWFSANVKDDGTVAIPDRWLHLHYYGIHPAKTAG